MSELFQRWQQVVAANPDGLALIDRPGGNHWSFAALDAWSREVEVIGPVHLARADGPRFLAEVLACWRTRVPLLGLEKSLPDPQLPEGIDHLPADIVHLKRTSGSTGEPRLVLFDAPALVADCAQIVQAMGLHPKRPNLGFVSAAHSYGFSNLVLPLLLEGIPLVLGGEPFPAAVDAALAEHGPAFLPGVPALWQVWLRAELEHLDRVALAISAGAPLPLDLEAQALAEHDLKIHNFFGSSECGGIAFDSSTQLRSDARQLGRKMQAVSTRTDADGRLIISGPTVACGYLPADPALPGDGSFHTSDRIKLDADGILLHLGRESEALAIAGRRVSPDEVETALRSVAGSAPLLVFGVPARRAERETDVVLLFGGEQPDLAATLRRAAVERLPGWLVPRHIVHCAELAVDERGKLSRARWRTWYLEAP